MKKYDILIIGSGLGGLECAYILAREGYSVCVLEKNRQLGGNLQIFARDKVIFDTGVHYIGGLDKGQNLHRFFSYMKIMDQLKIKRMDENGFDRVSFVNDPKEYRHAMGYQNFVEILAQDFPHERKGLQQYVHKIQEICDSFPIYRLKSKYFDESSLHYAEMSAKAFIESCIQDQKLRNVLAGTNPLYAGYPDRSPLHMHALVMASYIESAWKCIDGGGQIARLLAKRVKENGGEIYNYSKVDKFIFEDKEACAVETTDGRRFEAKQFISNIHPTQTIEMIDERLVRKTYRKRILNLENSISVFILHLVLKPNSFPYLNYNCYHYEVEDVWSTIYYDKKTWPQGYVVFVPAHSKSDTYADSINVMAYMRYSEVLQWADTYNTTPRNVMDRGQAYTDFKEEKAQRIVVQLEKKYPGIKNRIHSYYTSTPLSYRDYIGTGDGSMYGVLKDYNHPLNSFISPRTKIPNIFLTGQNLNMHGMLGVTIGALITCAQFVGMEYLINKIKKE